MKILQKVSRFGKNESPSVAQLDTPMDRRTPQRPVQIEKLQQAYHIYKKLIVFYGTSQIIRLIDNQHITFVWSIDDSTFGSYKRKAGWILEGN